MKGIIKTVNTSLEEEFLGENTEVVPQDTIINFKASNVSAFYTIKESEEDVYLYINLLGIEYPLKYDAYIEKVLQAEIEKEEQ
jgi:hypothetical protein